MDIQNYLQTIAALPDGEIDLALAALAASAQPGIVADRYINHLRKISEETAVRHRELLNAGAGDDAQTQLAALKYVLADTHGYRGDGEDSNDLQNASLIRVIDRAKGSPVTLAILYIHAARAQGWDVAGLDFPGHFLFRIGKDGRLLIFDPFHECKILEAPDLRRVLKKTAGDKAELSAGHFQPASNRAILLRLQNNIKYRQIEMEDYEAAFKTVETMRIVDPGEYRLLLDAGVLGARTNRPATAIKALEDYIKLAPNDRNRHDAAMLLQELKSQKK